MEASPRAHHSSNGEGLVRRVRGRPALVLALAAATGLVGAAPTEAKGKPSYGCPPSFDPGALTLEQAIELPRIQAGLTAGVYDEAALESSFNSFDHNGDGVVCFQDVFGLTGERANPPPAGTIFTTS